MAPITRQDVGVAIAQLMPRIIQGVRLDFFLQRGVTQTQFLVLMALHGSRQRGECTMGALAKNMHVRLPTATGIVSRLVRTGYVRRRPRPQDRRHVLVALTPKGEAFITAFQGVIRRRWEEVLQSLEPRELAMFHQVITRLNQQLQHPR